MKKDNLHIRSICIILQNNLGSIRSVACLREAAYGKVDKHRAWLLKGSTPCFPAFNAVFFIGSLVPPLCFYIRGAFFAHNRCGNYAIPSTIYPKMFIFNVF